MRLLVVGAVHGHFAEKYLIPGSITVSAPNPSHRVVKGEDAFPPSW